MKFMALTKYYDGSEVLVNPSRILWLYTSVSGYTTIVLTNQFSLHVMESLEEIQNLLEPTEGEE